MVTPRENPDKPTEGKATATQRAEQLAVQAAQATPANEGRPPGADQPTPDATPGLPPKDPETEARDAVRAAVKGSKKDAPTIGSTNEGTSDRIFLITAHNLQELEGKTNAVLETFDGPVRTYFTWKRDSSDYVGTLKVEIPGRLRKKAQEIMDALDEAPLNRDQGIG